MSEWASIQSTPPWPCTEASPPSVPSATEWSPPSTSGSRASPRRLGDPGGDQLARVVDLGKESCALVAERRRFGDRGLHVPLVANLVAETDQPLLEPRVADRRRPHVDPAPTLPEIERGADDRDFALRLHAENLTGRAATLSRLGEVAQLVEHTAENRGVAGSIPALAIVE